MTETILEESYNKADIHPRNEWGWRGIVDPVLVGGTIPYAGDLPLLDYTWSTSNVGGVRKLKDLSPAPKYEGSLYFGRGVKFNGVDQNTVVSVNATVNTIYSMIDGVHTYDETLQTLTDYTINQSNTASTHQNYIFYNGIFTSSQKTYLENNPEKFLYMENGVLSSNKLEQVEIDNVVSLLPMCEVDGFVRDMVGYSEGANGTNGVLHSSGFITGSGTITDNIDGFTVAHTAIGESYVRVAQLVEPIAEGYYKIQFTPQNISDSCSIKDLDIGVDVYQTLLLNNGEEVTQVLYADGSYAYLWMQIEGSTDTTSFDITDIKVIRQEATYPIANFTSSARDAAITLQSGLQTCFLKRDVLGVPIASSFDRIQGDGVGYADTGYFVDYTEAKQIELVVSERVGDVSDFGDIIKTTDSLTTFYVRFNQGAINNIGVNCNSYGYTTFNFTGYAHISINILTLGYELFFNGVSQGFKEDGTPGAYSATLDRLMHTAKANMPLFKVHTKPQDPLDLYNTAVAKGLLI